MEIGRANYEQSVILSEYLEQDLVLDEKDLREKIAKVRRINGDFGKIDELVALYDEIEAKAILLEKPV